MVACLSNNNAFDKDNTTLCLDTISDDLIAKELLQCAGAIIGSSKFTWSIYKPKLKNSDFPSALLASEL